MTSLVGKVVLITGGNSGIGRAAALAFAVRGAKVVIAARRVEQGEEVAHEVSAAGGQAVFVRADVSKPDDVEALVGQTVEAFGRLDCAFNNAATEGGVFALTAEVIEEEYDRMMDVNLKGVWLCMKHEIRRKLLFVSQDEYLFLAFRL